MPLGKVPLPWDRQLSSGCDLLISCLGPDVGLMEPGLKSWAEVIYVKISAAFGWDSAGPT